MPPSSDRMAPPLALDRRSRRPLHVQIAAGFREAIAHGELVAGQQVPSSRQLAVELGISRLPALTAYAQLAAEGYLEARAGAGTYVARELRQPARAPVAAAPRRRQLRLAGRVRRLPGYERPPWLGGWGAFGMHQPALEQFPFASWSRLLQRHGRNPSAAALRGMHPQGSLRLREAIAAYLRTARGVACDAGQVMLVSGSQQALDLCARVLCNPGETVWMEEPGYWLARQAFTSAGCRLAPVRVDANGVDVAAAIRRAPRARMAYLTPAHQFPLGATLSASRRMQLLDWADSAGAWILEDDYDAEFRYDTLPIASIQSLDRAARVIYIGTFSKVLFPSLRIGYLVLPRDLVRAFLAVRYASDICPSYLVQEALADFLEGGHFARHIQRMRRLYGRRRAALARELGAALPGWRIEGAESGLHLVVAPPRAVDDIGLSAAAAAQGLWLWPLSPAYARAPRRTGFILGFGSATEAELARAVGRLAALLGVGT